MAASTDLPAGPRYPAALQGIGFWNRPLGFLERCRARYGKRFTLRLPLAPPFVVLSDPGDVKQVFTAPADVLHPGSGAKVLEPLIGSNSVILLDGAAHMEQRKLMLPAFHGEKMERLSGLMAEVAEREVASWPRCEPIELHPRTQALTLEIVLRAVFGLDPGPRLDALRLRLGEMLAFGDKPMSMLPPPDPDGRMNKLLERVGAYADFLRYQRETDELMFELIEERRRADAGGDDILAMLLEARHDDDSPMSDQEVRDELMTLLIAGHETTASTLAWTFEQIQRRPDVLAQLTSEIDAGGGDAYLTATIQETLRHRPVLPNAAPRLVVKPIEVGGWTYPEGVCLVANGYLMHHDPDVYPDPYAFRPERFLDESPGTYTWIPFGGGRRRCIGASFAMLEAKLVLRTVLASCEVRATGAGAERARRRNITIRPARGASTVLRERGVRETAAA